MQDSAEYCVRDGSFGRWVAWIEDRYLCLRRTSSWARFFASTSRANGMVRHHALRGVKMSRLPGHWLALECAGALYRYHGPDVDVFKAEILSSKARAAIWDAAAPSSAPSGARDVCGICFDEERSEADPIVSVCECGAGFHLECMVACHVAGIARCPACRRALVISGA